MSYASHAGIPNPLALAAVIGIVFATLFGEGLRGTASVPPSRMEQFGGHDAALAPSDPVQGPAAGDVVPLFAGYVAEPQASYDITALVLERRNYRVGVSARVAPMDFVLGWGEMSNPALVDRLDIRQGGRFGYIRAQDPAAVDVLRLGSKWANTHIVPANDAVRAQLETVSSGRLVRMTGHLVDVYSARKRFQWRTSTSRRDRGNGACEIILVETVEFLD